jgi:hypothetical protein
MIQKGTFPSTGMISFESQIEQLELLSKGLIRSFPMEAIVSHPDNPEFGKRKLRLIIENAFPPKLLKTKITTDSKLNTQSVFSKSSTSGILRAGAYFFEKVVFPDCWVIFGTIQGGKPIQIIILLSLKFDMATYSLKKEDETEQDFNAQLN